MLPYICIKLHSRFQRLAAVGWIQPADVFCLGHRVLSVLKTKKLHMQIDFLLLFLQKEQGAGGGLSKSGPAFLALQFCLSSIVSPLEGPAFFSVLRSPPFLIQFF